MTADTKLTVAIKLKQEHIDAMIAHALEDAPIECCGLLASKDGIVERVQPAKNQTGSKYRFDIDPREYFKHERSFDDAGLSLAGIYHSHTGTPAVPSATDIRAMGEQMPPPFVHFVIGVADLEHPEVRVWHIEGTEKFERSFEIVD